MIKYKRQLESDYKYMYTAAAETRISNKTSNPSNLTPYNLHANISPPELITFTDFQFRIKITFTKSISSLVLKLVKIKNSEKKSLGKTSIPIYIVHCPKVFLSKHF